MSSVMKSLIFDIETNGLLLDVSKFWVGVTYCIETKEERVYYNAKSLAEDLNKATTIIGHNIIGYDIPALKILSGIDITTPVVDTLLLAKLAYYDKDKSWSHSLDAYGERLGEPKGKHNDWSKYTQEMEVYCKQDVKVTYKLYKHLKRKTVWLPETALQLEQDVQKIVTKQYLSGWKFNIQEARRLHVELVQEKEDSEALLWKTFTPKFIPDGKLKEPKRPFKRNNIYTVGPHQPISLTSFNPGSGNHIVWWVEQALGKQEWDRTEKGNPKTDSATLQEMFNNEEFLKPLLHYLEVNKLLGQLAEGDKAWLKLVHTDGRLHGSMDILGTVSGRASHSNPNLGQIPSPRAYKGEESRELFTSENGMVNVGADLSGVELRCLAHYMYPYDKGRYANIILEGDIHTANKEAAGLATRDQAKTFIYSVVYGGGDAKVGTIINGTAKDGKRLKTKFFKGTPGFKELHSAVATAAKRGWIKGITGRRLYIRSSHSALNTLLQSLGSYISKYWMIEVYKRIEEEKLVCNQIGWIHDELQFECKEDQAEILMKILEESSITACEKIGIRMPIHSEAKQGKNWKEVH